MTEEKKEGMYGITPKAEVMYAWLEKAQPGFKDGDAPKLSVTLKMNPEDGETADWLAKIKEITGDKTTPIKPDKESDSLLVKFHTLKRPPVVDTNNHKLPDDVTVGRGSVVRVAYGLSEYPGFGGGFTLYLNAIQVIKLVEYKSQAAFPDTEEGYVVGDTTETTEESGDEKIEGANMPF